jgi:hypothetical protein
MEVKLEGSHKLKTLVNLSTVNSLAIVLSKPFLIIYITQLLKEKL